MKHDVKTTLSLLGWTLASLIVALMIMPIGFEKFGGELERLNPFGSVAIIVGLIGLAAIGWWKMMKHFKPKHVIIVFGFGMALLLSKGVELLLPFSNFWIRLGLMVFFYYSYVALISLMQKSWLNTKKYLWINNAVMAFSLPVAAVIIGVELSIIVSVVILFLVALYDAWAVWKSKTMIVMAKYFTNKRMIPGIAIAKKHKKEGFAMLGGGDIFFIVLVATTFYPYGAIYSATMLFAMFLSVVLLFWASAKGKFYPALPYIFAGALVGFAWICGGTQCVW